MQAPWSKSVRAMEEEPREPGSSHWQAAARARPQLGPTKAWDARVGQGTTTVPPKRSGSPGAPPATRPALVETQATSS